MRRPASTTTRTRAGRTVLVLLMLGAVVAVAALAYWDSQRESAAALDDFVREQTRLATALSAQLAERLAAARRDALTIAEEIDEGRKPPARILETYAAFDVRPQLNAPSADGSNFSVRIPTPDGETVLLRATTSDLLGKATQVEEPGSTLLLVVGPGDGAFRATDGRLVMSAPLETALAAGNHSTWLERSEAASLGLPPRTAAAGLAQVDAGALGRWGIAVVTSAERVRDRELRAHWRAVLSVVLAAGLVLAFGTIALGNQRRELLLEGELAVNEVQRERDERLSTASRAAIMGTLAMGIAHEVSTPLGIIAGRAEQLLARMPESPRNLRCTRDILEQTERIRGTVRGFLDVARGGAPALGEVEPDLVLLRAVELVEHRFESARIALEVDAPAALPAIRCDVTLLQQALVNLLLNACDACEGGGRVVAHVGSESERVVFTVSDEGVGISPEVAARALEPFFTTKPVGLGTGLGLAISHEIVKLHRGELVIAPDETRGTRVRVIIPIARGAHDVAA